MNQQEEHLEVENMRKEIDNEFALDVRNEYFDKSEKEESEYDERKEESEYEEEGMLCIMFSG